MFRAAPAATSRKIRPILITLGVLAAIAVVVSLFGSTVINRGPP